VLCLLALSLREPLPSRRLLLAGLACGAGQLGGAYAIFEGFARAPIALVVLLFYIYPLLVTLGAAFLYGEDLTARRALVVALGLAGIALIVGVPESLTTLGVALGLFAGVCIAAVILASRYLMVSHGLSPLWLSALMFTSPAIALVLAVPARSPDLSLGRAAWGWAVCAALISATLPVTLFYTGVKLIGPGTAALLGNAEPLVAVLLGYIVLDETLTALQLVGGALIVGGVVLLSLRSPAPRRSLAGAGEPR
jgi:drug/metabolite transporter (DMT)-like permease